MELNDIRNRIDEIDDQLFALFEQRMEQVALVAEKKKENGINVTNRVREREILTRMSKKNQDLATYTRMLFGSLFSLSKSYQREIMAEPSPFVTKLREAVQTTQPLFPRQGIVAIQGAEGSYSQEAAYRMLPHAEVMFFRHFDNVFDAVDKGLCEFGVLPIENSANGSVKEVYELMHKYEFNIVRAHKHFIDHQLLVKPGVQFSDVKEIFSQRQALGQCSEFLNKHPEIIATEFTDTAMAAAFVAESDRRDIASLSSRYCADLYGLTPLPVKLQNSENNYTRFICITKKLRIYPGSNKISLVVSAPHEPGGLYHLLARFSAVGLNITKLESRSIAGRDFEFLFYFDFEGSTEMEEVQWLLEDLSDNYENFQFLGNYLEV